RCGSHCEPANARSWSWSRSATSRPATFQSASGRWPPIRAPGPDALLDGRGQWSGIGSRADVDGVAGLEVEAPGEAARDLSEGVLVPDEHLDADLEAEAYHARDCGRSGPRLRSGGQLDVMWTHEDS